MSEPASAYAVETRQLSLKFGNKLAVDSLDLNIPRASIYGFLGPNGSGKSTSIRMLTGLLKPSAGTAIVLGQTLPGDEEKLRLRIGYMTQKFSLYDNLSVQENLDFVARIYGLPRVYARGRRDELIALYELKDQQKQLAGSMSGGQKQRLALAAATLHKPELLFLDEPTSAVDPENRREFWERLFDLSDNGTTILVSTHYMDEAERCHQLAILDHGVKRADGTPQALMNAMNAWSIEVSGDNLRTLKAQLEKTPEIVSAAQIGARLRVLIHKCSNTEQPLLWLQQHTGQRELEMVRPNLEDVFVNCTGTHATQNNRHIPPSTQGADYVE
jgi:ABC-2 type transport system ATP-binding protein